VPFSHGTTVGIGLPFAAGITSLTATGEGFAPMVGTGVVPTKHNKKKRVTTTIIKDNDEIVDSTV
jgi:hypothetical protein